MGDLVVRNAWLAAALFAGVALSGCVGAGSTQDDATGLGSLTGRVHVYGDPAEDARFARPECESERADGLRHAVAPQLDQPAHPSQDVRGVYVEETPELFIVELELAALDSEFQFAAPPGACGGTSYQVFWTTWAGTPSYDMVTLRVARVNDVLITQSSFYVWCNKWWWCEWDVPVELHFGTPGSITWKIPRVLISTPERGDELVAVQATTAATNWPAPWKARLIDSVEAAGDSYVFSMDRAEPPGPGHSVVRIIDAPGDEVRPSSVGSQGEAIPGIDILAFEFIETPTSLTFAVQLAAISEKAVPRSLFEVGVGLPSRHTFYAQVEGDEQGERITTSWLCMHYTTCMPHEVPPALEITSGPEGWQNLTIPRAVLDSIEAGSMTHVIWAVSGRVASRPPTHIGPFGVEEVSSVGECPAAMASAEPCEEERLWSDWAPFGPPYWFVYDSDGAAW